MSRRYIASLAVVAVLTLAVGLVVRRRLRPADPAAAAAPPSEAAALQQLSMEGQVRRLSSFLKDRATDVSALVEYVPEADASGLRWHGDTLVTTFADRPVAILRVPRGDTTRTALIAPPDSLRGEWALIVGRRRDGGVVSAAGLVGGQLPTTCHGRAMSEFVVGVPIPDGLAGAGVFDLGGRVIGMVAGCDGRLVALPVSEMMRVMTELHSLGPMPLTRFGFAAGALDATARAYFLADSGLLVTEVSAGGAADLAGWLPGDVIVNIDGVAIDSTAPRVVLDSLAVVDSHVVVVRRDGAPRTTHLTRSAPQPRPSAGGVAFGLTIGRPSEPGVAIDDVRPGSAADSAGLRSGDRLIRLGRSTVTTPAAARRLLDRVRDADSLTFIVFRRDSVSRGVWLRR